MAGLENCPKCGTLFVKDNLHEVCKKCYKEEERMYDVVSRFLRKRENRAATIATICAETLVEEELIYKWVKKGRLRPAMFPNLGYPCSKCGTIISEGTLCRDCQSDIKSDLHLFEEREKIKEQNASHLTYQSKIGKTNY